MQASRSLLTFIGVGAVLGLALPCLFRLIAVGLGGIAAIPSTAWSIFDLAQLLLWPTPLLMVPTEEPGAPDLSAWGTFTVATLANVALYAVLATLSWLGLSRSKVFLVLPLLIIGSIWYVVWKT